MKYFLLIIIFFSYSRLSQAQSVTDLINGDTNNLTENLTSETVEKVSGSRRILVLTNNNSSFDRGDFVTLVLANELAVRGLVAKLDQQKAAFKITKIYSIPLWKNIKDGIEVKIIRGDDSYFNKKGDKEEVEELADSAIKSEEDLYNDTTLLEEDIVIEDKSKRVIQTDNVVTVNYGFLTAQDTAGDSTNYTHPNLNWMYQLHDNIWGEIGVGINNITDYPTSGLTTTLSSYTLRLKYAFATPFFSYTLPYVGYQIRRATNESAGIREDGDTTTTDEQLNNEVALVDALNENSLVFGVTILKRLVPGWFARLDVGTDIVNLGIGLEF